MDCRPVLGSVHVMLCGREACLRICSSTTQRLFMALATRLAAATERYWAVFGALALVLSFYDAVWTPVLAMLPLPFPPSAMAWGFVLDALFLAGIAAHAALLTREAWRARLHSASFFVDLACCLPIEALGLAAAGRVMPELRLIKLLRLYRVDHVLCARIREDVRWNWNRLAVVRIILLIALCTCLLYTSPSPRD